MNRCEVKSLTLERGAILGIDVLCFDPERIRPMLATTSAGDPMAETEYAGKYMASGKYAHALGVVKSWFYFLRRVGYLHTAMHCLSIVRVIGPQSGHYVENIPCRSPFRLDEQVAL